MKPCMLGVSLEVGAHWRYVRCGGHCVYDGTYFAVDLVRDTSEVVVRVLQGDLSLVGTSTDLNGLVVDGVVGVGVRVAELLVDQVVNVAT